jgi:AraC-like DNA-binding protein
MRRAAGIDDFVGDPVGRYSVGATHLVWCHSTNLCGTSHWGQPSEIEAGELVRRLDLSLHPSLAGGFDAFMDVRGMEKFDWGAFGVVSGYVRSRLPEWARRIRHHAIVVPPGVVGVFVAGLMPLLGSNHPLRFFSEVAEAVEWLGREDLLPVLDALGPIVQEARGVPPLLRSLREYLDRSLSDATVKEAAHALGLSPRSLQREMRDQGTQFTHELMQARVRAACVMLEHSDEKIESIARRVGCTSSSQLSGLFRREVGETPARYRTRRRG